MKKVLLKLIDFLECNELLKSVKRAFEGLMPVIILGIISDVILSLPIDTIRRFFVVDAAGIQCRRMLLAINRCTFGIFGVYVAVAIAYNYSRRFTKGNASLMFVAVLNTMCSLVASLATIDIHSTWKYMDTDAVFWASIVAIVSTKIFFAIAGKSNAYKYKYVGEKEINSFSVNQYIVPLTLTVMIFAVFNVLVNVLTGCDNIIEYVTKSILRIYVRGDNSFVKKIIAFLSEDILTFMGVGRNEIMGRVYNLSSDIITFTGRRVSVVFLNSMSNIGGIGNMMSLAIALLICTKSENVKNLVKCAFPTLIFNINDIIVYGLPVVFNPFLMIPFLVSPAISKIMIYLAVSAGMFSDSVIRDGKIWSNAPVFISGYIASGHNISGILLQVIMLVVGVIVYIPFVKAQEMVKVKRESAIIDSMKKEYMRASETQEAMEFINYEDDRGRVSREILEKLIIDIEKQNIELFYQPQNGGDGLCYGGEALLRWKYNGEYMFPSLVTEIAKEGYMFKELCEVIVDKACQDTRLFKEKFGYGIKISVNINSDLLNDRAFLDFVIAKVKEYEVCGCICLEITEESSMFSYANITENIKYLASNDIGVAIDDFSMGHTSIKYLQNNRFGYVKLDGSLVKEIITNKRSRDIVEAITKLGHNLDFRVVAEYVDSEEIKNELIAIGCNFLQGYYFSPAINKYKFMDYVMKCNR